MRYAVMSGRTRITKRNESAQPPTHRRDAEKIEQFKQEMASGELASVLGINKNLTGEQEQSLQRLEDKWMSGMQGHYNAAEERKPS